MQPLILSLGGSIISTASDNTAVIQQYVNWLTDMAKQRRVAVIIGGGHRARAAMQVAKQHNPTITSEQLDEVGIAASRENAEMMRKLCQVEAEIITDPRVHLDAAPGLVFGAGWIPGRSTDYDAVLLAITNQIDTVYNISNITQIYTADPNTNPDAQPLAELTWQQLQQLVGDTWTPGLNMPFDPIAAKLATESNLTVKVVNGHNLAEVAKAIENQPFVGTIIHS